MTQAIDMAEARFGRLCVIGRSGSLRGRAVWQCKCVCGAKARVLGQDLRRGKTRSCGCLVGRPVTHGHSVGGQLSGTYRSWRSMLTRCRDPKSNRYQYYGGRGISVCDRWKESFKNFLVDMGERPAGKSLDRLDNDGNYEPSNCRWATPSEQRLNSRPKGSAS